MARHIADGELANTLEASTQISIARPSKGAEPLVCMRLLDGGACPNHFSTFAARVARGGHLCQTTMRLRLSGSFLLFSV